jgi:hypothetical protein
MPGPDLNPIPKTKLLMPGKEAFYPRLKLK